MDAQDGVVGNAYSGSSEQLVSTEPPVHVAGSDVSRNWSAVVM